MTKPAIPKIRRLRNPDMWLDVRIDAWAWDYSFSVSYLQDTAPYSELNVIELTGTAAQKKGDALRVQVRLLPIEIPKDKSIPPLPTKVGSISRVKGGYEGVVIVPAKQLPMIQTMLAHNLYAGIDLSLVKQRRLDYEVQSYSFRGLGDREDGDE